MKTATGARAAVGVRILGGALLTVWLAGTAHAANLTWDTAPGTVGAGDSAVTGGAGTWDTTNGNWTSDGGATNVAWNSGTPDSAIFAGASSGLVTLGTSLTTNSLTFNTAGYTIGTASDATNTLTLSGAKTINLTANAQINSVLKWTGGLTVNLGGNTLSLAGPATPGSSGGSSVAFVNGTVELNKPLAYWGALGVGAITIGNGTDPTTVRYMQRMQQQHQATWSIYKNGTLDLNGFDTLGPGAYNLATGQTTFYGGGSLLNGSNGYNYGFKYVVQPGGVKALITSTISTTGYATDVANDPSLPVELEIAGSIVSTSVTKTGLGTLLLSGSNSYTGTTNVSAGRLLVTGTHTGGGAYTVANTGVLGGTGTIGIGSNTVTVQSGGAVAPGMSIGTLSVTGNVTFAGGSFFDVEFNGTSMDRLDASGSIDLGGATLRLYDLGTTITMPQTFTILSAGSPIVGTFAGYGEGSWLTYKGFVGQLSYTDNQVRILNFIPEPAALTILALGSALCLRRRK